VDLIWLGGEGPKDIPPLVYVHLMTNFELPADKLTGLRSVLKTGFWEGKPVTFIRIYDSSVSDEARQVKDFTSLDEHADLILYEGYWEKGSDRVFLECRTAPKTSEP
jgi:hypothetical protein